jgi:hypothetical protein
VFPNQFGCGEGCFDSRRRVNSAVRRFFYTPMDDNIRVSIISPPDRELLAAEIMIGTEQWAELNQEGGTLSFEFYARRDGQPWRIGYEAAIGALLRAKERLAGR